MAGNKNSGRRVWSREERIHHMRDKSIEVTIDFLESKSPLEDRAKIAAPLAAKELTEKQAITGQSQTILIDNSGRFKDRLSTKESIDISLPTQ